MNYDLLKPQTSRNNNNIENREHHTEYYNTYAPRLIPSFVVQHIHSVLRFVFFFSILLCFLWVSGRCVPYCQQFLLYDFILSSFYAFFMLDVAVFLTLLANNKSTGSWRSQFPDYPDYPELPRFHFPVFDPIREYYHPATLSALSSLFVVVERVLLFMHYLVEATIIGCYEVL